MVLIMAIIVGAVFAFLFMDAIGGVQASLNLAVAEALDASPDYFTTFSLAATFVTNLWTYMVAVIFIILAYWAYIYSQRKGAGY